MLINCNFLKSVPDITTATLTNCSRSYNKLITQMAENVRNGALKAAVNEAELNKLKRSASNWHWFGKTTICRSHDAAFSVQIKSLLPLISELSGSFAFPVHYRNFPETYNEYFNSFVTDCLKYVLKNFKNC